MNLSFVSTFTKTGYLDPGILEILLRYFRSQAEVSNITFQMKKLKLRGVKKKKENKES